MRSSLRRRRIVLWIAAYTIWLAALAAARVNATDSGRKPWDLRIGQVWRMASTGVREQAPHTYPLYGAALACLTLAVPFAVWAAARARDDAMPGVDAIPNPSPVPARTFAAPDLLTSGAPPYVWTALAGAVSLAALLVMTPAAVTSTFGHANRVLEIPNGFASGMHAWHVSRAESLTRGSPWSGSPGWIAHHQGGYPAEAAPIGLTAATVAVATATLGRLPMAYAHTVVAIAVFLLPVAGFIWMARRDGWPPAVGAAAAVMHVVIPGADGSGGYRTIVSAGRVEDAAAAAFLLLFLPFVADVAASGSRRSAAAAAVCAAAAISMTGSAAVLLLVVATAAGAGRGRRTWRVLGVAALLSAPAWIPLLQSAAVYRPVPPAYASLAEYLFVLLESVTPPVCLLALAGAAVRQTRGGRLPILRITLIAVLLSAVATAAGGLPYVEVTRLTAFERLLVLYLASVGLHAVVRMAADALDVRRWTAEATHVAAVAALAILFAGPWPTLPSSARGLFAPRMSADVAVADLAETLDAGRRTAPPATAVLVIGKNRRAPVLWGPVLHDGLFFYSDPGWHWRKAAPPSLEITWDTRSGAAVPQLLSWSSLHARGIGLVIAERAAWPRGVNAVPMLRHVHAGIYFDAFAVREPSRVVDWTGSVTAVEIADNAIVARGVVTGREVHVRRNWHPGWRASIDGRPATVHETRDGFMRIDARPGPLDLQLTYVRSGTTVPLFVAAGALVVAAWILGGRGSSGE